MRPSSPGELVEMLSSHPEQSGLFTDFDGTLAPIVPDPEAAAALPPSLGALSRIAGRLGRVVVVSGRPARFLVARLAPVSERIELYGLHGLERWESGAAVPAPAAKAYVGPLAAVREEAENARPVGLVVEDKTYGITLHWRSAPDPENLAAVAVRLARHLADSHGLLTRPGKASIEIIPPLAIDKGTVLKDRSRGLRAISFLGDDVGDLTGFEALDTLEDEGLEVARVAVTGPDAPRELVSRADVILDGPEEVADVLVALAEALALDDTETTSAP